VAFYDTALFRLGSGLETRSPSDPGPLWIARRRFGLFDLQLPLSPEMRETALEVSSLLFALLSWVFDRGLSGSYLCRFPQF